VSVSAVNTVRLLDLYIRPLLDSDFDSIRTITLRICHRRLTSIERPSRKETPLTYRNEGSSRDTVVVGDEEFPRICQVGNPLYIDANNRWIARLTMKSET